MIRQIPFSCFYKLLFDLSKVSSNPCDQLDFNSVKLFRNPRILMFNLENTIRYVIDLAARVFCHQNCGLSGALRHLIRTKSDLPIQTANCSEYN